MVFWDIDNLHIVIYDIVVVVPPPRVEIEVIVLARVEMPQSTGPCCGHVHLHKQDWPLDWITNRLIWLAIAYHEECHFKFRIEVEMQKS